MSTSELSAFDVIDLMTGYQQAAALHAGATLGIYDVLAAGPATASEVASRAGTDPSATLALLDSLVGMQLLTVSGGAYASTPMSDRLASGGDLRLIAEKESFLAGVWLSLADSVRTGTPQLDPWHQRIADDPEQVRTFLQALVVLARETGPDLTQLPGFAPGVRIADFGGALGSYSVPLAAAGASVTLADLPAVIGWAEEELASVDTDVRSHITLTPVDLLAPDAAKSLGIEYDIVLLSHLLHDLDDDDCATVLALARSIARPGGLVAVFELPGDPPGSFGPLFDLMMRVETPGRARRIDELMGLLTAAGLTDVRQGGYSLPHAVVLGVA